MYFLRVFLGYCSVALIVYPPRPIESFRLDGVLSTRFSRLLFRRPYFLPFSANKIFSPALLLFHRPYCLPLSTNRIFSAGPCNVCAFFSAIVPSPLLFTPLGQQNLFGGTVFWQCVFLGYCSVAYFVLLKCSENHFNVTKIKEQLNSSHFSSFCSKLPKMYHALKAAVTNGILVMNQKRPKSSDLPEGL